MMKFNILLFNRMNILTKVLDKILKSKAFNITTVFSLFLAFIISMTTSTFAQVNVASPANWLYPDGNLKGTKNIPAASDAQDPGDFIIKWSTPEISGDITPLIGNIINNPKIVDDFPWAPNEITGVIGDKLLVIDAAGRIHDKTALPPYVSEVSVLFDSLANNISDRIREPVVVGLATSEFENKEDSLAFAYLAGFDHSADSVKLLKRLAIDLRRFYPNLFASVKPVLGRRIGGETMVYATVNMSKPAFDTNNTGEGYEFFRGFTQFNTGNELAGYPFPDVGDDTANRLTLGPEVHFSQPSYSAMSGSPAVLLPNYPSLNMDVDVFNPISGITTPVDSYLMSVNIGNPDLTWHIFPTNIDNVLDPNGKRAQIRPYFIDITDKETGEIGFILLAEEYIGIDSSEGTARLHLYDKQGIRITLPNDTLAPPFQGGENHLWSIATGDVDGNAPGEWLTYSKNPGKELIVTQSTREFSVPSNRLFVLRYNSGPRVDKPSPPNAQLYHFDTLSTFRINGWVAAVNDIDGSANGKEEIFLVDGSNLIALRMRDFDDELFRFGEPFDTVMQYDFRNQTISSVAIADLEGDGMNDIVVTTFDSTYVIGTALTDILHVYEPTNQQQPPLPICIGDTLSIKWTNTIRGQNKVNILFEVYNNGSPTGDTLLIEENVDNDADSVEYKYHVDESVEGGEGRFIVQSASNPEQIYDTTSVLTFAKPIIAVDQPAFPVYYSGDEITFTGITSCSNSISVEFAYRSSSFSRMTTEEIETSDGSYDVTVTVPSATFFNCLSADTDSVLFFRTVGLKSVFQSYSDTLLVKVLPKLFPVEFDTNMTACPSKKFEWDMLDLDTDCDSVFVSLSANGGASFTYLETVPFENESYLWQVPLELPDNLIMRFCCDNAEYRTDTTISNYQPKYIDIIAPNPFRPPREELEIVYKVPKQTNVTIRIFDAANRLVAEPVESESRQPGTAYCDRWDGRIRNGSLAANGMYYVSFELSGGKREIYHVFVRK